MIIPEIHLIFDLIFDLILFNFRFNFHIGTTPACSRKRRPPFPAELGTGRESENTEAVLRLRVRPALLSVSKSANDETVRGGRDWL